MLKRAGYFTGLVGKWHLGMQPQYHPTMKGFDHFTGFLGGGNSPINPTLEVDGKSRKFEGSLPDILTDDALAFVKKNKDRPFALMLNFRAPHLPYAPVPKVDSAPFAGLDPTIPDFPGLNVKQVKNWTREYYASVHSVDRNLGRLLALLDELGLTENTIVVFTSDHGYMIGHHGLHTKGNAAVVIMGREKDAGPTCSIIPCRCRCWCAGPASSGPAPSSTKWSPTSTPSPRCWACSRCRPRPIISRRARIFHRSCAAKNRPGATRSFRNTTRTMASKRTCARSAPAAGIWCAST